MEKRLSIYDLQQKRYKSLAAAEKAVRMHPDEYRAVREIVRHVLSSTIDISRYDQTAGTLSRLLETLVKTAPESIFCYFQENIDPRKSGSPAFLRAACKDLDEQIKCIDRFREDKQKRRIINPPCFHKNENNGEFRT
ncbi:MAG: hypothetical protein R6T92_00605 [Desulfosalsimonadaceae bacterium]